MPVMMSKVKNTQVFFMWLLDIRLSMIVPKLKVFG